MVIMMETMMEMLGNDDGKQKKRREMTWKRWKGQTRETMEMRF